MKEDFTQSIARQAEKLRHTELRIIEGDVAQKRIDWVEQHVGESRQKSPISARQAFELFFFDYMGLDPEDLPIISESDDEIAWRSCNRCPTLEACQALGLDTRTVCRAAYEKSTQAFFSALDPQLRFHRSYEQIRPHAVHCREFLVRIDFEEMMSIAIDEAQISKASNSEGYGAVVVLGNEIVAQAHDTVITSGDPSRHAEVNAIRQAVEKTGDPNLCGAVLFSSCEPCPMCSSLAVWANMTSIVYGASIEETARLGKSRIHVPAQEIVDKSPAMIEVLGGVLKDQCMDLYSD